MQSYNWNYNRNFWCVLTNISQSFCVFAVTVTALTTATSAIIVHVTMEPSFNPTRGNIKTILKKADTRLHCYLNIHFNIDFRVSRFIFSRHIHTHLRIFVITFSRSLKNLPIALATFELMPISVSRILLPYGAHAI